MQATIRTFEKMSKLAHFADSKTVLLSTFLDNFRRKEHSHTTAEKEIERRAHQMHEMVLDFRGGAKVVIGFKFSF